MSSCSVTLEEVAMAAAADTTARIRAAASAPASASTRTPSPERRLSPLRFDERRSGASGASGASASRGAPPWALVPVAPIYPWQWPCVPMESLTMSPEKPKRQMEMETLRELAELRSRFNELQDFCSRLEKENAQLKTGLAEGGRGKLEETCRQLEQDVIHLKKALKEREEGEKSLRRLFDEAEALKRNVISENDRLKQELGIVQPGEARRRSEMRRHSTTSESGSGMIEVDMTGDFR